MTHALFDRRLIALRKHRAMRIDTGGRGFLAARVAEDLGDRLEAVKHGFGRALALGGPDGLARRLIEASGKAETIIAADLLVGERSRPGDLVADDECLPFAPESFDLAVSLMALNELNDVPGALMQIASTLKPDGLFLAAFPGGETLTELRQALAMAEAGLTGGASPRVAPMIDVREAGALMQRAGFALPVADTDRLTVRYDTLFDLIRDLREMGLGNSLLARNATPPPRALFLEAAARYAENFSDADGRIRATFEIVSLSGWKPHASQPRPLRPGSARVSLADVLGKELDGRQADGD